MLKKTTRFIMVPIVGFGICAFGYLFLELFLGENLSDAIFPYLFLVSLILGYYLVKFFLRTDSKLVSTELTSTVKHIAEPAFLKPVGVLEIHKQIHKQTFFFTRPKSIVDITFTSLMMGALTNYVCQYLGYDKTWKLLVTSWLWFVVFVVTWLILYYFAHKDKQLSHDSILGATKGSQSKINYGPAKLCLFVVCGIPLFLLALGGGASPIILGMSVVIFTTAAWLYNEVIQHEKIDLNQDSQVVMSTGKWRLYSSLTLSILLAVVLTFIGPFNGILMLPVIHIFFRRVLDSKKRYTGSLGKLPKNFWHVLLGAWFSMSTFSTLIMWLMSGGQTQFKIMFLSQLTGLIVVLIFGFKSLNNFRRVLFYTLLALCGLTLFIF